MKISGTVVVTSTVKIPFKAVGKVELRKNKLRKRNKDLSRLVHLNLRVVCSCCGAFIRSSTRENEEQMCLICHARMLNEYFQNLKRRSDEKRDTSRVASE